MGVNAEGKISLSVELQNFKDIASDLKKGLSAQLKQVPLDIEFNNKDLEKKAAEAVKNINTILSKSRVKYLDLSSILPSFVNEINKEGISEEIREQMVKGFETALTNLRDIGIKQDYSKLKGFSGEQLKDYISDLNDVMDILNTIEGLNERQKQGLLTTVLPSLSDLKGRGKDAAKKEYTKGAKKLDAILKLSDDYGSVLQYGVNPTATITALNSLSKKAKSGEKLTKGEGQDLLGYLLRGKFLGIEFGKSDNENLKDLDYDYLLQSAKESLDKATIEYIENKSEAYFAALDKIYNSSVQEISYSDLTKGIQNTTNQKMQNMYDAEISENSTKKIRAGSITKRVIKLSSKEKPELRKSTQNEDEDTGKVESQPQDTDEEKIIQDYKKQIEQIDNELRQIDDKLDKAQNKEIQLKKQLPIEENKLKEKERDFQNFQNEHVKYTNSIENAKREKSALENTVTFLNQQLEEEKAKRDEIKNIYDELVSEREEIKRNIENGEKQLEKILPPLDEEINTSQGKLDEAQKGLDNEKAWINFYNAPLAQEYKFKNKKEAYQRLKQLGEKYREFRENPSSSKWTDKEAERMRFVVKHYKAWQAAKEIGIADSRLYNEQFDTDNDYEYQEAIKYLQQHKQREEEIYKEIENEVQQLQDKINKLKQQKEQLNKQLSSNPRKAQEDNRKAIEKKETELSSSDINISKLEKQKQQNETKLAQINQDIEQNQETDEDKARYEERLKQLEEERNTQKKIYDETKKKLQEAQQQQIDLDNRQVELEEKKDQLLEKQKQAEEKLEIKRKEEEQRRKEEAERAAQEAKEHVKKEENTEKEQTEKTEAKKDATSTSDTSTPPSIPPEKLQEILTLLGNIQKALGTLEDGSDIPSITQSVKNMADALKELSEALGEIKQKDFNFNIGLPNNNPIGQQGEIKRKVIKELELQYNEFMKFFGGTEGLIASAKKYSLSQSEYGDIGEQIINQYLSPKQFDTSSLVGQIDELQYKLNMLFQFSKEKGLNLDEILSNSKNPSEIIKQISEDIVNTNPVAAISKIFEDIKISIDASMAQINTESKGFNFLSGSAEEAAEAKRKFVEANKDVLQSIVASMPKIEQEAEALEKFEGVKNNNNESKLNNTKLQKEEASKSEIRKGYFDFEAMPDGLIEQRFNEVSPLPVMAKGASLATNKIKEETQSSVELLEELHIAWDRGQQEIKDIIYDSTIENMQQEYAESQRPQYNFEPDYEDLARQAQEARQYYEDQISNDFEVKAEAKLDLAQDETGQLSLFDNILPEDNWGQELRQEVKSVSEAAIEGQISFQDLENAINSSEKAFTKLMSSKNKDGKAFLQNTDLPTNFLKTYDGISKGNDKGYKATSNLKELKNLGDELADVKTKLKVSFDDAGNLKSSADPLEVQDLLNKYDQLIDKIERLKLLISSPSSQESFLLKEFEQSSKAAERLETKVKNSLNKILTNKNFMSGKDVDITSLDEYFKLGTNENLDRVRSTVEEINFLKQQLAASKDDNGNIIGDPAQVAELVDKYNNLTNVLKSLIDQIRLPNSAETIGLKIAKDAEKAKKELDKLKEKVDTVLGKSNLFEAQTLKTAYTYGVYGGDGEGQRGDLIASNSELLPKDLVAQQKQVEELVNKLKEYRTAVAELQNLRTSDDVTLDQLEQANDKVKTLKDSITVLSQTIKTSGIANASKEQVDKLKSSFELFLSKNQNLTEPVRDQIEKYIEVLSSGATVSKAKYNSMIADLNKFNAAQTRGTTIWDQMVGKMREGIAFLATKFSFYQIFNQFRQGFEVIHQFDDALTEMMKVSDETRLSLERYQKTTFDTADAIGTNALQIQNSTADFMRLGETLTEAAESAKTANVLMNVSEFQSIDEATKSLIAMGAAYDDLSKMNIIDKLNEVGNNYAISTSEAATALQASASALKTANNDMDEALALITAGNAVVQDATKVGTGMRTIALRLTGTKTAKEELEEMGEETENVITTQSKLRDTIKEATAVASNEFKGFDILDDNGNYKSTYEIMLGIADVYDEIVETDKQLGRNNVNLLLESVAGKNRANIAASIFQNPQVLRDAYKSSQEANGSAMKENEKFVQSISGHLAQLTNAWQEMWANAANRDVINFFIDAAKAAVNFANAVGVIPTTLMLLLPYLNLITKVRSKTDKGIVTQFLDWANGLNEVKKAAQETAVVQEGLNTVQEAGIAINTTKTASIEAETAANVEGAAASVTKIAANEGETASTVELTGAEITETVAEKGSTAADVEGTAASIAKTAANSAEAGSEAAAGAAGFSEFAGAIGGKLASGIGRITGAFSGLVSVIGAIPVALGVAAGAVVIGKKIYDAHRESVLNDAKAIVENIKTQQEATTQQLENYKQLKTQLDSGDLSEQETIDTKQKIIDLQKTIADQYGISISSLDLVNGKLEEQLRLIQNISQVNAENQYNENAEGFRVAEQEYNKNRKYSFKLKYPTDDIRKALEDSGFDLKEWNNNGSVVASINDDVDSSITKLNKLKQSLIETRDSYSGYRSKERKEAINEYIEDIDKQLSKAEEIRTQYEDTYLQKLNTELFKKGGYDVYQNYQSSVSDLESAYITGDTQKINEARKAFDEATKAKEDFLSDSGNEQFVLLFNKIDTSLINTKNRFRDTIEILKTIPEPDQEEGLFEGTNKKTLKGNAKAQSNLTKEQKKAYKAAKELYKLNPDKIDIKATLDNNAYASGKYADALNTLMNNMNWTTADADELINALVTAGIVHGDAADIAYIASDSYNVFSSSVEGAITSLNSLNTALTESAKGTGLTEQTLTELRAAFGDNLDSVLERTANGYHLNTEGAYLLRQQQEAMVNSDYASSMYAQYQALDKLQEGFVKAKEAGEDTSGFIQQRQAIQDNIDKLNEQLMSFNNANSAYQTWLSKQSSEGEREMYNSVYSGYDAVKDELERGWAGEKTRSWLDLIFNDENDKDFDAWTSSAEKIKEKFDEVTKDIEGTGGYSIADFFTVDDAGKSTSLGVWNFFDAIENKQEEVNKEFIKIGENGEKIFDFTKNGDYQIADLLGMDIESVHAVLRAAADAGFEVHLDQPLFSLEQLTEKANAAKQALEEATGTKLKINLDPQSESEVDDAMQKLVEYQQTLSEDTSIDPKVKTERLEQLADLMNFMAAKKREFVEGELFDFVDNSKLSESQKRITQLTNTLSSTFAEMGRFDLSQKFSIDPTQINDIDYLNELIQTINNTTADPNIDSTQITVLNELLEEAQNRIDYLQGTSNTSATVSQLMAAQEVATSVNEKLDYAAQHSNIYFDWSADQEFVQYLDLLTSLPTELKYAFGIDPDATTEDLLELAQKGELNINVEATGNIPQDTNTTNTTTNETFNATHNTVDTVLTVQTEGTGVIYQTEQALQEVAGNDWEAYLTAHAEQAKQDLDEVNQKKEEFSQDDTEAAAKVDNTQANNAIDEATQKMSNFNGTTSWGYIHIDAGNSVSIIDSLTQGIKNIPTYKKTVIETVEKTTKAGNANGTAHAQGTAFVRGSIISGNAFAGGNWGLSKDQTALTGELGTEIVVRDGNWFTVGDEGAEFVNLQKGDIVFNHKQSEELLENGYVTSNKGRGKLVGFASGTAFSYGNNKGAIKPTKSSKGMGNSTTSSSNKGGGNNRGSNNNRRNNNNNNNKDANKTKNTLDEVEILIARIERQIANLDKTISNTYKTWSTRNNAIKSDLAKVAQEIKDQNKAYTTYIKKANSVGLNATWKKKVQSGKFKIEDVTDDKLWQKIQDYKTYYEKALAAKDAVIDLKEKEGELYKQRFDNEQTYYEELIGDLEHTKNLLESYNDTLSESGKLGSQLLIRNQIAKENENIRLLNKEYDALITQRNEAVNSGKIKKYSEAWYEMTAAIQEVSESIAEAQNNVITLGNNIRQLDWDRWDKIHDAIGGVNNELEFLYDLFNSDDFFDEQGNLTDQGVAGFALLAQQYDTYFREAQEYQKEIEATEALLSANNDKNKYDQNLVDKLKDLKEAQQDSISSARKMKDSMVDLTEDGIKKQIDYVKDLIEDYEDLLETQKDQVDYAKKIADQQKELNKLEKQYRAIQNDTSEEGAAKRQKLRDQINEKRDELQESQDDRRLSETKDMLSDFEESFEQFLEDKLKDVEGIVRQVIDRTNANGTIINDTIAALANSYGYTPSDTLKNALTDLSNNLVSYFNGAFDNENVRTIASGVDEIVRYYKEAQNKSEEKAGTLLQEQMRQKVKETGTHMQTYTDINGNTRTGFFNDNGTQDTKHSGWVEKDGKQYLFTNGTIEKKNQWYTGANGKKYYLDQNGARATGVRTVDGKTYFFGSNGVKDDNKKGWATSGNNKYYFKNGRAVTGWHTINKKKYYFNENGVAYKGLKTIKGKNYYFDSNGIMYTGWRTISNKRYYFGADGAAYTGWKTIDKKRYYFDANGAAYKGLKTIGNKKYYFDSNGVLLKGTWRKISNKQYYLDKKDGHVLTGKQTIDGKKYTFNSDGTLKKNGWKKGTASIPKTGMAWTNEGYKAEAIIRKSDGAILTPLNKGDSVIPSNAMKNMYQALTDPEKYLKQYTTPDVRIIQGNGSTNNQSPTINMQFVANGVQDPNKFVNELMNNKKLEKWIQEVTLGQANGHNSFRKYSYAIR